MSAGVDNDDLVDNLKAANYITTPLLERVFRAVDRGDYFTAENREQAYRDNAWKKGNLHLSAPCIYAKVMEGLQLSPGHSFLNLGSGTGYLSTMAGLIVGPYGVNHGVELHADVLKYSLERLEEFKKNSPAIDAFNFCDPQFVQGNCLCMPPDVRLYDRVYCGASCPESREQYMKSLIKPGGVLVMPINDQLVKMTRNGPDTWETVSLLPVSFSSLVMPDPKHPPPTVSLPLVNLMSDLQDLCRQQVRAILRANIDLERPNLSTAANKPVTKHPRQRDRRNIHRIVVPYVPVPFYEPDDDEDSRMLSEDEDEDDIHFEQRHTAHQISAFFELARDFAGHRRSEREERRNQEEEEHGSNDDELDEENEEEDDDEEEEASNAKSKKIRNTSNSEETQETPKKPESITEKPDEEEDVEMAPGNSNHNSGSTQNSGPTQAAATPSIVCASSSTSGVAHSDPIPVLAPAPTTPSKSSKKREKFDSGVGDEIENGKGPSSEESDLGDERDVDMDIDDSSDSDYSDNSAPRLMNYLLDPDDPSCPCGGGCGEAFRGKKSDKKETEDEEGEGEKKDEEKEEGGACKKASAIETYSTYMREKIKLLPLPLALKLYLNYNREL